MRMNLHPRRVLAAIVLCCIGAPAAVAGVFDAGLQRPYEVADRVLVEKSERKLHLLKAGRVLRTFEISLGLSPKGHKQREGDSRTPEGLYYLGRRNPDSDFFLSIHITYPNDADRARARAMGVNPGGAIMIHGTPNVPRYDERQYVGWDWTDGCIAVSNSDMIDIWLMTREGIPIEIRP